MLADLVKTLVGLGKETAEKNRDLVVTRDVAEIEGLNHLRLADGSEAFISSPQVEVFDNLRTLGGFEDALRKIAEDFSGVNYDRPDRVIVRTDRHWATVLGVSFGMAPETDSGLEVSDDERAVVVARESTAGLGLEPTQIWKNLERLRVTIGAEVPVITPRALVNLLTQQLGAVVDRSVVAPFRNVDFQALRTGNAVNERGKTGFGKTVEATVQSIESIPERILVRAHRFYPEVMPQELTIRIDPVPESEGFQVYIRSEDFEKADRSCALTIHEAVERVVSELNEGREYPIRIIRQA